MTYATGFIIALFIPLVVGVTTYAMDRSAIVALVWGAGIDGCYVMLVAAGKIEDFYSIIDNFY